MVFCHSNSSEISTPHKLQNVHEHGEAENEHKARGVNYRLYPARNGLAEYPLDKTENYLAAVERGYGQKVENGEIDPYICRNFQKLCTPCEASCDVSFMVVTGPPIAPRPISPVISSPSTLKMVPAISNE